MRRGLSWWVMLDTYNFVRHGEVGEGITYNDVLIILQKEYVCICAYFDVLIVFSPRVAEMADYVEEDALNAVGAKQSKCGHRKVA